MRRTPRDKRNLPPRPREYIDSARCDLHIRNYPRRALYIILIDANRKAAPSYEITFNSRNLRFQSDASFRARRSCCLFETRPIARHRDTMCAVSRIAVAHGFHRCVYYRLRRAFRSADRLSLFPRRKDSWPLTGRSVKIESDKALYSAPITDLRSRGRERERGGSNLPSRLSSRCTLALPKLRTLIDGRMQLILLPFFLHALLSLKFHGIARRSLESLRSCRLH